MLPGQMSPGQMSPGDVALTDVAWTIVARYCNVLIGQILTIFGESYLINNS